MIIVKSNELIEASYKITLDEMRILLMTIGKIDPFAPNHRRDFEFTVAEFAERFGVDTKIAYQQIQKAVDMLGGRWAVIEKTSKFERKVTFLTEQVYFKGEGKFQIILHEKLMPFVSEISGKFTRYNLEYIAKFKSFYAMRIYEIVAQFRNSKEKCRDVLLSDLKEWLQVTDKYDRWNNFKQWVLEPAIAEINEKSDLAIEVVPLKRGRAIHTLKFLINLKADKSAKDTIKPGRPTLPKRPQVKAGSHEEGEYFRECETLIRKYWKGVYNDEEWRDILPKLPDSELELLQKFYRAIGDDCHKTCKRILDKRSAEKA